MLTGYLLSNQVKFEKPILAKRFIIPLSYMFDSQVAGSLFEGGRVLVVILLYDARRNLVFCSLVANIYKRPMGLDAQLKLVLFHVL